jgi:hypothetical protein
MIEGVAQEVDVAPLEGSFGKNLADGRAEPCVSSAEKEILPGGAAFRHQRL